MLPFTYKRPRTLAEAVEMAAQDGAMVYAGGTTMLDLMKLGVYRPGTVVDITFLDEPRMKRIAVDGDRLRLGALVSMHAAAEDATVKERASAISESLWLAASSQLRHMATLGGNVMQRTRDPYFRDPAWIELVEAGDAPATGPSDQGGYGNTPYGDGRLTKVHEPGRFSAVLGTSETDTASYPGDFAQPLAAFGATVEIEGPDGPRAIALTDLHVSPADKASETDFVRLAPGEIITGFSMPLTPTLKRSIYLKARDRESYAFANASAAVGLEMDGETVRDVRIGLGGVATVPWRSTAAEDVLRGNALDDATIAAAGEAAFADAVTHEATAFKVPLGRAVIAKALTTLSRMEA